MSQGFASGSEGDMRREWWRGVIHSNLDQVWRLWEGFWAIYCSRAKCHCISFFYVYIIQSLSGALKTVSLLEKR